VDAIIALEFTRSLDTFPGRGDLDQDALLLDANGLVESNELLGLLQNPDIIIWPTLYTEIDVDYLLLSAFLVEGQASIDLCRDTARDDLQDGLAELDELYDQA
jgi:hypothetical protein